jgi:CHAT domain-containing protein/tetratricopeptide (TPR) repeat protein
MVANERGDYATGELHSRRAAKKFEIAKNRPGYLRARFEQAYSARLSHEANECYVDITSVLNGLSEKKYSWLSIQSTLEAQECLNMLGKVGRAASLSAVTIREAAESRYPVLAARALLFAADIDEAVGDISSAWKRTHEGLAWSWNARLPRMRVYSFETELETLANDAGQGHFDECVIRDSLKLLDGEDNPLMRAVEHHRLAEVALLIDDSETAEHEFVAAEELFASSPSNRITDANRTEAEIWLARVQVQRRQYAKARELLERNRESLKATSNRYLLTEYFQSMGRAQMGLGDVRGAEDSLLRALYGTESTLKSLRSETERLNWERESSSVYKDIVELKLKMGDTLGALEVWEWYRGSAVRNSLNQETGRAGTPENFNLSQAAQKASTAELMEVSRLRPSLDSSTVMSFAFLSDGLVVWIYDDRGVVFKRISDPYGEIPDLVRRFADLCADRNSDLPTLRLFAHRLFDIILQPVLSSLHLERLLVVEPDGPLWALPFAALIDRQEKYLIDSLVLTQLPGIYYRHRLANAHGIGREEKAMIVVSRESASANGQPLPLLPNAESEAHLVAGKFTKSVLLNGDNSSVISIRGQLPGLNLFHFVGHAVSTVDGTSLLLSSTHDDLTVLTSSDITGLHLTSVRLVFLSGCKTAKGAGGSGLVDSRNLASAFLRAGAGYVLASRWNIDSIGTESFVDTFYSSLLGGDSAPQALRKAAQRVRASTVHPYYWAAFDAFGSTV